MKKEVTNLHTKPPCAHKTFPENVFIAQYVIAFILYSIQKPLKSPIIGWSDLFPYPANLHFKECQNSVSSVCYGHFVSQRRATAESRETEYLPDFDSFCSSHKLWYTWSWLGKAQRNFQSHHTYDNLWRPALNSN